MAEKAGKTLCEVFKEEEDLGNGWVRYTKPDGSQSISHDSERANAHQQAAEQEAEFAKEERQAWDRYLCSAVIAVGDVGSMRDASDMADRMLDARRARFPAVGRKVSP